VRISGGRLRGRVLRVPRDVRPTEGRVREALFSIWREAVEGGRLLDLFAGSGAVALEAASRGALAVLALEKEARTAADLEEAVRRFGEEGVVTVRRAELPDPLEGLAAAGERFDLVFADPPYRYPDYGALLAAAAPLLATGGELALEHSTRRQPPEEVGGLVRVDQRRYGESSLSFYRRSPGAR
jgi:16S rRNA (guanine966-N2)-methyltransferase